MSQEQILKEAKLAIALNDLTKVNALLASSEEPPDSQTVSDILIEAIQFNRWDLIRKICSIEGDNKPSSFAITKAVEKTFTQNKLEELKFICEQSKIPPDNHILESILNRSCTSFPVMWGFIEYLCSLTSKNKPCQDSINEAFRRAIAQQKTELVKKICTMSGDNKPSQAAISVALKNAYLFNRIEEFIFICEKSHTQPAQKTIEAILHKACYSYPEKWQFIEYLCLLSSENKPSKTKVSEALTKATSSKKWELVKKIGSIQGDNKPNRFSMGYALVEASRGNRFDIVLDFCTLPETCGPGINARNKAFIIAAKRNYINIIRFYAGMNITDKPSPQFFTHALFQAARHGSLQVFEYLYYLKSSVDLSHELIGDALISAAAMNHLNIVKFILSENHTIKPEQTDIAKAFLEAVSARNVELVFYFVDPDNKIYLDQKTIDRGLLEAVKEPYDFLIIKRLMEDEPVRLVSKEGIQKALNKTHTVIAMDLRDYLVSILQVPTNPEPSSDANQDQHRAQDNPGGVSSLNLSMQILGGFITALGSLAVALALTVFSPAAFSMGLCGAGIAGLLVGIGLFAAGTYKKFEVTNPVDHPDASACTA